MAKSDQIIEQALIEAKNKGIKIGRALFIWDDSNNVIECDAFGAVLLKMGEAKPNFPKDWLRRICEYLEEDTYWFWRFNLGFANNNHFYFISEKDNKTTYIQDKVSDLGIKLRRKYYG